LPAPAELLISKRTQKYRILQVTGQAAGKLSAGRARLHSLRKLIFRRYGLQVVSKCFAMNPALAAEGRLPLACPGLPREAAHLSTRIKCVRQPRSHLACSRQLRATSRRSGQPRNRKHSPRMRFPWSTLPSPAKSPTSATWNAQTCSRTLDT
jgi:hypothetical protein